MAERPSYIQALIVGDLSPPSEADLALLLTIVGDERPSVLRTLLWLIQDSSAADAMVEQLWQRAVNATTDSEGVCGMLAALDVEADVEKLKSALTGQNWAHPSEILDPHHEIGVEVAPMLKLAMHQYRAADVKNADLGGVIARLQEIVDS